MIIYCDPPRHALLIHFGKRVFTDWPTTYELNHDNIDIALDERQYPPILVAIHFKRHRFYLPFLSEEIKDSFVISNCDLTYKQTGSEMVFNFEYSPGRFRPYETVEVFRGLEILCSQPRTVEKQRMVVNGFRVDTRQMKIELDSSEFEFNIGADNLKDVTALLFCEHAKQHD